MDSTRKRIKKYFSKFFGLVDVSTQNRGKAAIAVCGALFCRWLAVSSRGIACRMQGQVGGGGGELDVWLRSGDIPRMSSVCFIGEEGSQHG